MSASPVIPLVLSPAVRMEQERWAADLAVGCVQQIRSGEEVVGEIVWSPACGWEVAGSGRAFGDKAEAVRFLLAGAGIVGPVDGLSVRELSQAEVVEYLAADLARWS